MWKNGDVASPILTQNSTEKAKENSTNSNEKANDNSTNNVAVAADVRASPRANININQIVEILLLFL